MASLRLSTIGAKAGSEDDAALSTLVEVVSMLAVGGTEEVSSSLEDVEVSTAEVLVFVNLVNWVNWPNALQALARRRPDDRRMMEIDNQLNE
jgi:hypothetical protein